MPRAERVVLITRPSATLSGELSLLDIFSLPARSTKLNSEAVATPVERDFYNIATVKIACDLLDLSFYVVAFVVLCS